MPEGKAGTQTPPRSQNTDSLPSCRASATRTHTPHPGPKSGISSQYAIATLSAGCSYLELLRLCFCWPLEGGGWDSRLQMAFTVEEVN